MSWIITHILLSNVNKEVFNIRRVPLILFIFYTVGCSTTKITPGLSHDLEVLGCPALILWTAQELGIGDKRINIWMTNTLSSDIQPCNTCGRFKRAAMVLQDKENLYLTALAQVLNEFATRDTPPTPKQMESITNVIANNSEAGNSYALAGECFDAIATYQAFLISEMNFSVEEAVKFTTDKYVIPLTTN